MLGAVSKLGAGRRLIDGWFEPGRGPGANKVIKIQSNYTRERGNPIPMLLLNHECILKHSLFYEYSFFSLMNFLIIASKVL